MDLIKVLEARYVGGLRLRVAFSDGQAGELDFGPILGDGPMVEPLRSEAYFARAFVENGILTWPNGYDLDPNRLHDEMQEDGALQRATAAE